METVSGELQMELIYLRKNMDLKNKFHTVDLQKFYQNCMDFKRKLRIATQGLQIIYTSVCEQIEAK